jgi:hypothetical protein
MCVAAGSFPCFRRKKTAAFAASRTLLYTGLAPKEKARLVGNRPGQKLRFFD